MSDSIYVVMKKVQFEGDEIVGDVYYTDLKAVNREVKKLNNRNESSDTKYVRHKLSPAADKSGLINVEFDSSTLEKGQYDKVNEVLKIKFKNGRMYKYMDVPQKVFGALMAADSQGSFFAKNIKNQFETHKMRSK